MFFRVLSLAEANLHKNRFTHCVSISDVGGEYHVSDFDGDIYKIKFLDIEFPSVSGPQYVHIEQLAKHLREYIEANENNTNRLLIHCFAGISRSAAVGIFFCLLQGKTVEEAFKELDEIRPMASPNRLMIRYIDDYLQLKGTLIQANENHDRKFMLGLNEDIW